jgi:diguanylate cyclase (GGDEF)-like protein
MSMRENHTRNTYGGDANPPFAKGSFGDVLSGWVERAMVLHPMMRLALILFLLVLVATLDTSTGVEISFSIFYLLPVVCAGAIISRQTGQFVAIVSAITWGYFEIKGQTYSASWIPFWNAFVRFGFFILVNELVTALRQAYLRERQLSRTDGLTGIANTRVFDEHVERTISLSHRNGLPFTIAYIDLDKFKQVNDQFGHAEGDRLLQTVASHIDSCLRKTDTLARLGGDEFGILLPDTGLEQATTLLERIESVLASEVGSQWPVGATIGAVTFTDPPDNVNYAVFQADALMYKGKSEGRGRILQSSWPVYE